MLVVIRELFLLFFRLEYLVLVIEAYWHFLLHDSNISDQLHDVVELNFYLQLAKQKLYCTEESHIGNVQLFVCIKAKNVVDILHGEMVVFEITCNAFGSDDYWEDRVLLIAVVYLDSV